MKANELMIGDYIMFNKNIYIIEEISKKGWVHLIYNDGSECRVELSSDYILDTITPIPITEEILAKNGFAHIEKDYDADGNVRFTHAYLGDDCLCGNTDLYIGINNNGVCCVRWLHNEIYGLQFVHELQHAFKLLYIKREIKL